MQVATDGALAAGPAGRPARLAACLQRACDGELSALAEIVGELNPLLWHVARAEGLSTEDAADVVQTTWLELLRRMHEIRSPHALTAWLVQTTRREAQRTGQRRRRQPPAGVELFASLPDPEPEPTESLYLAERDRVLLRHFRSLSRRCRELLRAVAMVDRPDYSVVAEALGMPHGSIGPTRGRCLAKLREALLADPAWSGVQ
jgi:RNA polymerase sigma factor (sigma-70 family)